MYALTPGPEPESGGGRSGSGGPGASGKCLCLLHCSKYLHMEDKEIETHESL